MHYKAKAGKRMPNISLVDHAAPGRDAVHGLRWTTAIFEDSEEIVHDDMSIDPKYRDDAHRALLQKMNRAPWHGFTIYLKKHVSILTMNTR